MSLGRTAVAARAMSGSRCVAARLPLCTVDRRRSHRGDAPWGWSRSGPCPRRVSRQQHLAELLPPLRTRADRTDGPGAAGGSPVTTLVSPDEVTRQPASTAQAGWSGLPRSTAWRAQCRGALERPTPGPTGGKQDQGRDWLRHRAGDSPPAYGHGLGLPSGPVVTIPGGVGESGAVPSERVARRSDCGARRRRSIQVRRPGQLQRPNRPWKAASVPA